MEQRWNHRLAAAVIDTIASNTGAEVRMHGQPVTLNSGWGTKQAMVDHVNLVVAAGQ